MTRHPVWRKFIAVYLVCFLSVPFTLANNVDLNSQAVRTARQVSEMSYLAILEEKDRQLVSPAQLDEIREFFEQQRNSERDRLKERIKSLQSEEKSLQAQLKELNKRSSRDTLEMENQRQDLHCRILEVQKQVAELKIQREETLKVQFENNLAKVELAASWPAEYRKIVEILESGKARERRFGNVEDIGIREIRKGQEEDVKRGQDAIKELKQQGLMPPEIDDARIRDYINEIGNRIGANSDLKVPLQITVLDSDEINAFALPGGYLFLNSGLLLKAENESEVAGVIAHELAHVTARHGARLMKKASIANILFQGAQLAALILTGGAVSALTYYALEYGFFGLGLVLNLALLGVSRDYELEADQLGVQYLWKSGYDTKAFITFFDKMARDKGDVRNTSFFRTHPAFAERLVESYREITFLPPQKQVQATSSEFAEIQKQLKSKVEESKRKKTKAPSLRRKRVESDCKEPVQQQ